MPNILEELKRRNVVRVGIAYVAVAWLIIQVAETLLPVYGFTDVAIRNLVAVLGVGLFVTLALAWFFEWTPEGIFKDDDAATPAAPSHKTFDRFIIAVLVLALAFFAFDKFVLSESREAAIAESAREEGRAEALAAKFDQSVAVLPFANRSTLEDDVYFVDGIHDDILTQLARIGALAVTSRTSVEQYRGTTQTMKQIGEALGVRAILEGGVQRAGDRVRINVQLIDSTNDDHLWAQTYVRELTVANIFAVQAEIASAVANALRATLLPEEQLAMQQMPTDSIQAYDLYLLGRYHWNKRTKEAIDIARGHFEQAIDQDPEYVLALSGLADSYVTLVTYGNMTGEEAYPLAQHAIDQAMTIDDSVSEVWSSLGFLRRQQGNFGESEDAFLRALDLDDKNFSAWFWYSDMLYINHREPEALEALQRAYELEPMSFIVNERLANIYDMIGDFPRAIQHYERADQLDERDTGGYQLEIAWSLYWNGEYARAIELHRNILADLPDSFSSLHGLAVIYLSMGDIREAKRWHDQSAVVNSVFRVGFEALAAQQDYAGAIIYLEETLRLSAPRRNLRELHYLFRYHWANGDPETARTYLTEYVDSQGGRLEIHPRDIRPFHRLTVAAFWMAEGDEAEQDLGRTLAEEVHASLTRVIDLGWHRPGTFASLAATEVLLGNTGAAVARLNEAIDNGYKNQERSLDNPAFDAVREEPEFVETLDRMNALIEQESTRLAGMQLPPYTPPAQRQPIAVAREVLQNYVGWYSNGNMMSHAYFADDGAFTITYGPLIKFPVLAVSETEFYTPANLSVTVSFSTDDSGAATHFLFANAYGEMRMKRVEPPPPVIQLPRDILATYEGKYAFDRLEGLEGERTETDFWVAEIYVDEEGKIWIDYDDQPALEIYAYSETEFQLVGMEAQYRFVIDPEAGDATAFIRLKDGRENTFHRQHAE